MIDLLTEYAPNFRRALVDWMLLTPPDIEARVGLTDGNIRHLDLVPAQLLGRRPLPGWAHLPAPRSPVSTCAAPAPTRAARSPVPRGTTPRARS